ncbi:MULTISPECIES: hypothetical protein [unclassified Variovorax]|nr:hypothetical protein [Variovorax sp. YR750]
MIVVVEELLFYAMSTELKAIDLPEGWTCLLELKQLPDGAFSGKAELRQRRRTRCVLVLTQCATQEAALDCGFPRSIDPHLHRAWPH